MRAGLGHVNGADIEDSGRFLQKVLRSRLAEAEAEHAQTHRLVAAGARLIRLLWKPMWAIWGVRCSERGCGGERVP